jgi:hypothetical protein
MKGISRPQTNDPCRQQELCWVNCVNGWLSNRGREGWIKKPWLQTRIQCKTLSTTICQLFKYYLHIRLFGHMHWGTTTLPVKTKLDYILTESSKTKQRFSNALAALGCCCLNMENANFVCYKQHWYNFIDCRWKGAVFIKLMFIWSYTRNQCWRSVSTFMGGRVKIKTE